jgi:hypothetical protein
MTAFEIYEEEAKKIFRDFNGHCFVEKADDSKGYDRAYRKAFGRCVVTLLHCIRALAGTLSHRAIL